MRWVTGLFGAVKWQANQTTWKQKHETLDCPVLRRRAELAWLLIPKYHVSWPGVYDLYVCAIYCTCCATCYLEAFSEILLDTVKTKSSTAAMDVLQSCKWYWNVLEQVSHIEDAIRGSSTRSLTRTKWWSLKVVRLESYCWCSCFADVSCPALGSLRLGKTFWSQIETDHQRW